MFQRMRTTPGSIWPLLLLPALCWLLLLTASPATAAEQNVIPLGEQAFEGDGQPTAQETPHRQSRKQAVTIGVYLLAGVVFAGLALVALVALLGHHVRRLVRKPRPRRTHVDEFWYLRPKKEIGTKKEAEPPVADEKDEDTQTP